MWEKFTASIICSLFIFFTLVQNKRVNITLFDTASHRADLLPLSYTRSVADFRVGISTIREKWERVFTSTTEILTESYLQAKYTRKATTGETLYISSSLLPNYDLSKTLENLAIDTALYKDQLLLAFKTAKAQLNFENLEILASQMQRVYYGNEIDFIARPKDIFSLNHNAIESDFELLTKGKISQKLSDTNILVGSADRLFIEEGAVVEASVLNTKTGCIYIGKEAEIMENCTIRGPFALCEHAGLKMSAKIYGATTIGPYCKVGGEVNNAVFFAYSNKGHDGFIGNSVIGEWCNLGADTNNSNLKNNYGSVDVWNYRTGKNEDSGMQFHGLIMGDHAKSGINTMFNTGTVVGVSANVFGGDFPPKFIPSFSWGGAQWLRTFMFEKGLEVAEKMMERRGVTLTEIDIAILKEVFERDKKYRKS
jgi:UDP-N-acetylglucosamine diphosphorylase/glucosamine-1-phosphate N-acetyltransferase